MAWPTDHIEAIARQAQLERFHERTGGEFVCHEHITENPDSLSGDHRLMACSSSWKLNWRQPEPGGKVSAAPEARGIGASATRAVAVTGPMPGIVISRRAACSCPSTDLEIEFDDLVPERSQHRNQQLKRQPCRRRHAALRIPQPIDEPGQMRWAMSHHQPVLGELAPQRIDQLRARPHK